MIRLDSISRQHGGRILFLDASMAVFRGEKVGLVGPNGAGKSTVFRMIVGEEEPDSGQVLVEKRVSVGYFSQSVGEMGGRSVLEEARGPAGARCGSARIPEIVQVRRLLLRDDCLQNAVSGGVAVSWVSRSPSETYRRKFGMSSRCVRHDNTSRCRSISEASSSASLRVPRWTPGSSGSEPARLPALAE